MMFQLKPNLRKLKLKEDIHGLIAVLGHKDDSIRSEAYKSIVDLLPVVSTDDNKMRYIISALANKKHHIHQSVSNIFYENIELLSSVVRIALSSPSPTIKWRITEVVGRCKFVAVVDLVCFNLMHDINGDVIDASIWALESIGNAEALKCIEESKRKSAKKYDKSYKFPVDAGKTARPSGNKKPKEVSIRKKKRHIDLRPDKEKNFERLAQNNLGGEDERLAIELYQLQLQGNSPQKEYQIKKIGQHLCTNGGNDRMILIAHRVAYLGGSLRQLEYDWTGICGWQH